MYVVLKCVEHTCARVSMQRGLEADVGKPSLIFVHLIYLIEPRADQMVGTV